MVCTLHCNLSDRIKYISISGHITTHLQNRHLPAALLYNIWFIKFKVFAQVEHRKYNLGMSDSSR